ncbi:MAG TPA: hypothetical protein VGK43_06930 [Solirubrobacterales bacterium]
MKVNAKIVLPATVEVEVTIQATLGDLVDLESQLTRNGWSKAGELLLWAIRDAAKNVKAVAETAVERNPQNT